MTPKPSKLPYLQFYVGDWRSDPGLRASSFAARGLWLEMLLVMHEAHPRGHLVVGDRGLREADLLVIAAQTGALNGGPEVRRLLAELKANGVYSVTDDGVIFSRRMVRDEARIATKRANGAKGGSPLLTGRRPSTDNRDVGVSDNLDDNRSPGATGSAAGYVHAGARDRDQSPETRENTATPRFAQARALEDALEDDELRVSDHRPKPGPALDLATWFVAAALAAGALPPHERLRQADHALRNVADAEVLLGAPYPRDDIERRARLMFARKSHPTDPLRKAISLRTLSETWDWWLDEPVATGQREPKRPAAAASGNVSNGMPRIDLDKLR